MKWIADLGFFGMMIITIIVIGAIETIDSYLDPPDTIHCTRYIQSETEIIGRDCDNGVEMVVIKR
jgi:hypothetical protein